MVATTRAYSDTRNLARTGLGYDGVVRVNVPGFYGTGALLEDGLHVLTAAHVLGSNVAAVTHVQFETSAGTQTVAVSQLTIDPNYDPANDNGDLAILTLAAPAPVEAERYVLYREDDEIGQVGTLVGYGKAATGASGQLSVDPAPVRRLGENRLDATVDELGVAHPGGLAWHPAVGGQLAADFDNGLSANDAFGRLLNRFDTGLGDDESIVSPGDSGGPLFIQGKIAGVASYGFRLDTASVNPDIDSTLDSTFGEFAAWQRLSYYASWVDQALRADQLGAPTKAADVKSKVMEGDSGITFAWFLVTLGKPAKGDERISFHTVDGTAKAGVDYLPVADTVVFYAGEDHVAIPVEVIGNTRIDGNRSFSLVVSDPVNGHFSNGQATMSATRTIIDDDGPVQLVGVAGHDLASTV